MGASPRAIDTISGVIFLKLLSETCSTTTDTRKRMGGERGKEQISFGVHNGEKLFYSSEYLLHVIVRFGATLSSCCSHAREQLKDGTHTQQKCISTYSKQARARS